MTGTSTTVHSGLEGVVAAETRLSHVDGLGGRLTLAGLPVEVLAPTATFEETLYGRNAASGHLGRDSEAFSED